MQSTVKLCSLLQPLASRLLNCLRFQPLAITQGRYTKVRCCRSFSGQTCLDEGTVAVERFLGHLCGRLMRRVFVVIQRLFREQVGEREREKACVKRPNPVLVAHVAVDGSGIPDT